MESGEPEAPDHLEIDMSKYDDSAMKRGGHRHDVGSGRDQDGARNPGAAPGRGSLTGQLGLVGHGLVGARFKLAAARIEDGQNEHLPRLRASLAAGDMKGAREAEYQVRLSIDVATSELAGAEELLDGVAKPGARAKLATLIAALEELQAEARPLQARLTPARNTSMIDGWIPQWSSQAADRTATHDPAPEWDEHRATLDPDRDRDRKPTSNPWNETGRVIQLRGRADAEPHAVDVQATAAAGVAGQGQPLPHLETLQRSFGDHDLSTIEAFTGGSAREAADAIGAEAFATGNKVAFAEEPSLFVAAHEAAHVVQQRAGVQLLGGLGVAGDVYEQNADAVAERVVRGESAMDLLGSVGSPLALDEGVQRKETKKSKKDREAEYAEKERTKYSRRARRRARKEFESDWESLREETENPAKGKPFAEAGDDGEKLDGKKLGQAGYGARLLGAAPRQAAENAETWGVVAVPATAYDKTLMDGIAEQATAVFDFKQSIEADGVDDFFDEDPQWVQREKEYSADWATANIAVLERHQFEQARWVASYNDWVTLANLSHVAQAELAETASVMGYDTHDAKDSARFIEGLEMGLDMAIELVDAKVLGPNNDQSWSSRTDNPDAVSDAEPTLQGAAISPLLADIQDAYKDLQVAHHAIYRGLLEDQAQLLDGDISKVGGELAQLNATIAFWSGMAGFVEQMVPTVKGIATGKTGKGIDAKFEGADRYGYRQAKDAGELAHELETYQAPKYYDDGAETVAEKGQKFEDYYDTWGPGGADDYEKAKQEDHRDPDDVKVDGAGGEPAADTPSVSIPSLSIAGGVQTALTLLNASKLDQLNANLDKLNAQLKGKKLTIQLTHSVAAQETFRNAATRLQSKLEDLEKYSLRKRQQEMVQLGGELDSYAREHKGDLAKKKKGHLVPKDGDEIYGTVMALVVKAEQYRSLSALALGAFPFDDCARSVTTLREERAENTSAPEVRGRTSRKAFKAPPKLPPMSEEEVEVYHLILGTYMNVIKRDEYWRIRLQGVEHRVAKLMKKLEGMGRDNPDVVGARF
jgi:prefoldin subunit 5